MTSILIDRTDGLAAAAAIKGPCRVATTANISLMGLQTIDGVSVVATDRVLVKEQTDASENGIWVVDTGPWRRSKDFSRNKEVVSGSTVYVTTGTVNGDVYFNVDTANPIDVGTTDIEFVQAVASAAQGLLAETALQPSVRNRYAEFPECITGGVTDNLSIIQAAINSAVDLGTNNVQLPPGTFALSDYLEISTTGFSIVGSGKGITTLVMTASEKSGLLVKSADGSPLYDITLKDFSITIADAYADAATNCVGLDFENVAGAYIDVDITQFGVFLKLAGCFDIKTFGITSQGFQLTPNNRRIIYVTKATAPYGGAYGGNIYFFGCDLRTRGNTVGAGVSKILHCDAVDGLFFVGCYLGYAATHAAHIEKVGDFISGVKFLGCWFDTWSGTGVVFDGTGGTNGDCSVIACHFFGGGDTVRNLAIQGDWGDVQVNSNIIGSAESDSILVQTTGQNIQIVGNTIRDSDSDNAGGGEGINVADTAGLLIANNVIKGGGYTDNGIAVAAGSRVQITGNQIRGCVTGILTSGTLDQYMITGNMVLDNSFANINDTASGATKLVSGNLS